MTRQRIEQEKFSKHRRKENEDRKKYMTKGTDQIFEAVFCSMVYKGSSPFVQRVIGVKVHGARNYVLFVEETISD